MPDNPHVKALCEIHKHLMERAYGRHFILPSVYFSWQDQILDAAIEIELLEQALKKQNGKVI